MLRHALEVKTSVPISGFSVTAASAERSDQHSQGPRGSSPGSRWMRWSVTHSESTPMASPSWAISRRSLQRAVPPFICRSVSGSSSPTFSGRRCSHWVPCPSASSLVGNHEFDYVRRIIGRWREMR